MFKYSYSVCFDDVDAAGIVYYPRYFHLCHLALEHLFNRHSPLKYPHLVHSRRIGLPTVHVNATYKKPLFFGDEVTIELSIREIKNSSIIFGYLITKASDECFAAHITTVCIDLDKKASMPVPDDIRHFLSSLEQKTLI